VRVALSLLLVCAAVSFSPAQFKKIKSIEVTEEVISSSVDRPGDIYLTTHDHILKYDGDAILKSLYKNNPLPTLFDPHDGARMFAFYREGRKYEYLSPSFDVTSAYSIDSSFVIEPWMACLSGDHNLWVIDAADGSLKKVNTRSGLIETDAKINSTIKLHDINFMREYQGFVFVLVEHFGIIVFNTMGKQIRVIENHDITSFNFLGEELYYLQQDKLIFFDLFSAESREIKLPSAATSALLTDQRLFLIAGKTIDIFESNL
jgi:hypothetical protein